MRYLQRLKQLHHQLPVVAATLLALLAAPAVHAGPLLADPVPPAGIDLEAGDEITVRLGRPLAGGEAHLRGDFVSLEGATLTMKVDDEYHRLQMEDVVEILRHESDGVGDGLGKGAGIGAGAGALLGLATGGCKPQDWICFSEGEMALGGAVAGAAIGGVIGLLTDLGSKNREKVVYRRGEFVDGRSRFHFDVGAAVAAQGGGLSFTLVF